MEVMEEMEVIENGEDPNSFLFVVNVINHYWQNC
jgi:hypothetical protein